jgi:hypothetical protein
MRTFTLNSFRILRVGPTQICIFFFVALFGEIQDFRSFCIFLGIGCSSILGHVFVFSQSVIILYSYRLTISATTKIQPRVLKKYNQKKLRKYWIFPKSAKKIQPYSQILSIIYYLSRYNLELSLIA